MKMPFHAHLISLAAVVLSAGSAQAAVLWTTTFSGTNNTAGNASRTITNTPGGAFTDTLAGTTSALTRSSATGNFFLTSTTAVAIIGGGTFTNGFDRYNPNQNVDNAAGASWNSIFDFGTGTQTISLTDVTFNIYRFNSSGVIQTSDSIVRDVNISAEYTLNGGSTWTALAATKLVNLTTSNTNAGGPILPLNFALGSPVEVNMATNDFRIRYTATNNNTVAGAFNGITSMVFNGSVVPEPTVAMLGGLGLLGLLRRRRG